MRKIFNLIVWISSISILLLACSKDETENNKQPNDDDNNMVTVSLGMTGDILEVEESPLSKAVETADIYGVQIYSSPKDEDNYQPYGGGRFIDKSKIQVKLFKDRKYKFEVTVFPNGEYEVDENGEKWAHTGIKIPMGADGMDIADSIRYVDYEIGQLNGSMVDISGYTMNRMPIDRYYGKLVDYTPTENSNVNIDLKRVVAGLTFKIKGLTNQSTLKIEIEESPTIDIKGDGVTDELTYNSLMCLRGESIGQYEYNRYFYTDIWFENPVDEVPFKFTWTNGERTESFTQTVTLKRKMNYTFRITIPETFLVSNGITVTEEEATWEGEKNIDIFFEDIIIESEEDLKDFASKNYSRINGHLTIQNFNINSWDAFNNLEYIAGNLTLSNLTTSQQWEFGSWNIGAVGGNLIIQDCRVVFDYLFPYLNEVGGDLKFLATKEESMDAIGCLKYWDQLQKIGGCFEINSYTSNNFKSFSFTNMLSLKQVGGDIILKNLPAFERYCELQTVLQNHTGQFIVSGNAYNPTKEQILAGECSIQ